MKLSLELPITDSELVSELYAMLDLDKFSSLKRVRSFFEGKFKINCRLADDLF